MAGPFQAPTNVHPLKTLGKQKDFAYTGLLNAGHDIVIWRSPTPGMNGYFNHQTKVDNRIFWATIFRFHGETIRIDSLHGWLGGFCGRTSISQHVYAILQHQGFVVEQPTGSKTYYFQVPRAGLW